MDNTKIAEYVDRICFPSNISIIGGIILILYLIKSPLFIDNLLVFLSSIVVYFFVVRSTKRRIKSETKKYTIASAITIIFFLLLSSAVSISKELYLGLFSLILIMLITHFVRDFWKISTHSMTYAGVSTILSIIDIRFAMMFIFLPLIVWSRLKLKKHNLLQIAVGLVFGFLMPLFIDYAMKIL